jgi:hypothetical protein
VTGEITVFNPNDAAVNDVAVSDAIDDPNATCVVSNGSSTIPGAGHITFDYACTYSAAPDAVNETSTALISWPAQTLANLDSLPAGSAPAETAVAWDNPFVLNGSVDVGDSLVGALASLSYTDPSPTTFTYPYTFDDNPPGTCTSYDNTAAVENDAAVLASDSVKVEVCSAAQTWTGQKVNVRWHYSANGSSGSWSGTKSTTCDGSALTIGPQAMEGDLKLAPGTTLTAGYDFTIPGNNATLTLTFNNPRVVFALRCVSGAGPSQSTLTVPMSTTTSTVKDSAWYPSGDQHSPLVYQGSVTVPNVCAGGQVTAGQGRNVYDTRYG